MLDTSIASFVFKASPLLAPYRPHLSGSMRCISFQTVAEMRFGARSNGWGEARRQMLDSFLNSLTVLGYSDNLATSWAEVMLVARRAGRRLESGDAWIAATAALLDAPLLTHDEDFDLNACPSITVVRYGV